MPNTTLTAAETLTYPSATEDGKTLQQNKNPQQSTTSPSAPNNYPGEKGTKIPCTATSTPRTAPSSINISLCNPSSHPYRSDLSKEFATMVTKRLNNGVRVNISLLTDEEDDSSALYPELTVHKSLPDLSTKENIDVTELREKIIILTEYLASADQEIESSLMERSELKKKCCRRNIK
ncbi:hypothetical protein O0L34_g17498 [Tuta absoluta]|nr:hypothetical protein O0L34_g17498 [Tuta absoluta]